MNPLISIITIVYNGESSIRSTIESIVNQSFADYEYLIIDGQSSDRTVQIINEYKDKITHFISEPDKGVYDAMNKGLSIATGKYLLFINSGDQIHLKDTLERVFSNNHDADVLYGETCIVSVNGEKLGTRSQLTSRKLPVQLTKNDFLNGQVVSHQSFIPKRNLCPNYNLRYKCSSDIDWMLKILSNSREIKNTNTIISNYLQGGISDRKLLKCWKERFIILCNHFPIYKVVIKHALFVLRFLKFGSYRIKSTTTNGENKY